MVHSPPISGGSRVSPSISTATSRRAFCLVRRHQQRPAAAGWSRYTVPSQQPNYGGSLFVSDLASGLYVSVTPVAPLPTAPILVPVQGSGIISVTSISGSGVVTPIFSDGNTTGGTNDFGGQILRVLPNGTVNTFAYGFDTSGAQDYTSFINSSLTISFSSDGTTLYASDDDAVWQFKTTADLASSTSGTLVGLNDLRTLGVPYDGQNSAVAVVDTGVDASVPSFRGRVAPGTDIFTNGYGNQDLATYATSVSSTTGGTGGGAGAARAAQAAQAAVTGRSASGSTVTAPRSPVLSLSLSRKRPSCRSTFSSRSSRHP